MTTDGNKEYSRGHRARQSKMTHTMKDGRIDGCTGMLVDYSGIIS